MITVYLNRQSFQYDVHSLVRAFYPEQEVQVKCEPSEAIKEPSPQSIFLLEILFQPEAAQASQTVSLCQQPGFAELSRLSIRLLEAKEEKLHMNGICQEGDRKESKNILKRLLYRLLSEYSGRTLPWGNLTGIRPTKIPMMLLNQGWKNSDIASYMRKTYYTSNEKTALAIAIANREHHLLEALSLTPKTISSQSDRVVSGGCPTGKDGSSEIDPDIFHKGYSLYIGIPFCPSICLYCSFSSSPIALWKEKVDSYLDALLYEIESVSALLPDRRPTTVYIGGGTPTTLEPEQMERLLAKLDECFEMDQVREFTVEAGRPDSISRGKLAVLKAHGVTRISINPQTMNQETLDFIGRRHTTEQTVEAFYLARDLGFDNINMDLIVGLPGEGAPEVEHTMRVLSDMRPDSITVHSLAVKRAARLRLFREEHQELSFENSSAIMDMTAAYTREAGLHPYYLYRQKNMAGNFENVGYAREGCEGLYNILIMEEIQTIIALGAGAASKLVRPGNRIERVENVKDIRNYMERIDEMIERKRSGLHG
ncbi:MAG: coproporphyrinogen dehydrogenase HemZ [Lachnospiraceae bacterium]|nr:coproporphyrinogen dehydrogenase HemZ [Lachnospiraceae bacterium]